MIDMPINGLGGSILIEVIGYEKPVARNDSDANWLRSRIRVAAGSFSAEADSRDLFSFFCYQPRFIIYRFPSRGGKQSAPPPPTPVLPKGGWQNAPGCWGKGHLDIIP